MYSKISRNVLKKCTQNTLHLKDHIQLMYMIFYESTSARIPPPRLSVISPSAPKDRPSDGFPWGFRVVGLSVLFQIYIVYYLFAALQGNSLSPMGDGQRGREIRSGSKYVLSIFAYWIFRGDGMVHKEQSKVHTSEPFA